MCHQIKSETNKNVYVYILKSGKKVLTGGAKKKSIMNLSTFSFLAILVTLLNQFGISEGKTSKIVETSNHIIAGNGRVLKFYLLIDFLYLFNKMLNVKEIFKILLQSCLLIQLSKLS